MTTAIRRHMNRTQKMRQILRANYDPYRETFHGVPRYMIEKVKRLTPSRFHDMVRRVQRKGWQS